MVLLDNFNEHDSISIKKRRRKMLLRRSFSLLPNIFTLGNAFFGFCSIILSAKGDLVAAAYFILLGALMDALDGRIARLFGVGSAIGVQLDSLSDAISFCLAPAFMVYFWQLKKLGFLGLVASAFFLLAGLWRLARFNVIHEKQKYFFLGLPTTIAACFTTIILLNCRNIDQKIGFAFFLFSIVLFLGILMVSSIKFPTFKQHMFKLNKYWYFVITSIFLLIAATFQLHRILLFVFLLYFSGSIILNFLKMFFDKKKGMHEES